MAENKIVPPVVSPAAAEKPKENAAPKAWKCNRCGSDGKSVKKNHVDVCPVCFAPISWLR